MVNFYSRPNSFTLIIGSGVVFTTIGSGVVKTIGSGVFTTIDTGVVFTTIGSVVVTAIDFVIFVDEPKFICFLFLKLFRGLSKYFSMLLYRDSLLNPQK